MSRRINALQESPCYKCTTAKECMERIRRKPSLMAFYDSILGNADFDYHACGIYIAITVDNIERSE